jgi:hypothetical protein
VQLPFNNGNLPRRLAAGRPLLEKREKWRTHGTRNAIVKAYERGVAEDGEDAEEKEKVPSGRGMQPLPQWGSDPLQHQ